MDTKALIALAVAWIIPVFCGWLSKQSFPGWAKFLITVALSAVLGTATLFGTQGMAWDWTSSLVYLAIIGEAEAVYRLVIKNIPGATDWLAGTVIHD